VNSDLLCRMIDEDRPELISLCRDVIRISSQNPPGHTEELAGHIARCLRVAGLEPEIHTPRERTVNLMVSVGQGRPHLVLNGHMDTFPASEAWTSDPLAAEVKDGKIIGLGACDMKAGLSASLWAFLLLAHHCRDLPGTLSLCLVSDEETGGQWGTRWMLTNTRLREADACLIGEPGGLDVLGMGEKGSFWFRLGLEGRPAHGAYDILGESAVGMLCQAIPALERLRQVRGETPVELEDIIEQEKPYVEEHYGPGIGDVLTRVSVNIGKVGGGTSLNLVPHYCRLEVDMRLPIGVSCAEVRQAVETELRLAGLRRFTLEPIASSEPTYSPPGSRIVRSLARSIEQVCGPPVRPTIKIGATDARFFRHAGIDTVTYGPGLYNMGKPDEFVPVEELVTVAKVHACTITEYFGRDTPCP